MPTDLPTHADPYPSMIVTNDDDLKALANFANLIRLQGNILNSGSTRGYLAWWSAITKWNDHRAAMACTQETLYQVKGHPMERELSRLILAAAEYFERLHGDGSEKVLAVVQQLRELGFEPVLHRATIQRLPK